eukprot:CAMPEP_0184857666 /NCGR_PEP_ID=MMETSP0580-20130426/2817_1 /TAXON_ID=1118495 /ORGANISM="Dactyliosolen fragilissimus" /LENGTH=184 /DNA_ID=CAMNT_0027353391 /DNA_START=130 /DNA_END=681 /DNA_ORIENTATION=+
MTVEVTSGRDECFQLRAPKGIKSRVSGRWDLIQEGTPNTNTVRIVISSVRSEEIFYASGADETLGKIHFDTKDDDDTKFKFCIRTRSRSPRSSAATIGFSLRVDPYNRIHDEGMIGPDNRMASMSLGNLGDLHEELIQYLDHLENIKVIETSNRDMTEVIFSTLWRWTLGGNVLLGTVGVIQIW